MTTRVNWKTISASFTGLLMGLSVAPYELGDVATIIPPEWKARLFMASAIATFVLRIWKGGTDKGQVIDAVKDEVRENPDLAGMPRVDAPDKL